MVFVILILLSILLFLKLRFHLRDNRRRNKVLAGLLPLSTVPTMELKSVKCGDPHYETCAICIRDFVKGDEVRTLHCSHGNNRFLLILLHHVLTRFIFLIFSLSLRVH